MVPTMRSILQQQQGLRPFHILSAAIEAVGLEHMLEGRRPVTLFAPDDRAFNQLDQEVLRELLKDSERLKKLIEYHMVPLALTHAMLVQTSLHAIDDEERLTAFPHLYIGQRQSIELPTVSGDTLLVTLTPAFQVQGTRVLKPELEADNGIIYPLEQVLCLPELRSELPVKQPSMSLP